MLNLAPLLLRCRFQRATNKTYSRARHRVFPRVRRHNSSRSKFAGRKVAFAWAKLQPPRGARVLIRRRNRRSSPLLFLAEFLEARIIPERIERGIEPEQRGSQWGCCICEYRYRQQFL